MALFRRKNRGVLDLTEKYRRDQEKAAEMQSDSETSSTGTSSGFGFLGDMASASSSSTTDETVDVASQVETRRREISKKFLQLTEKIEDLSNQIYHLQQRIEVLERKSGVGGYWAIKYIY